MYKPKENKIYLEKKLKVLVFKKGPYDSKILVATINKNIDSLGYIFSDKLLKHLSTFNTDGLVAFYDGLVLILKKIRGAHKKFKPMYPNFPQQVIEMSDFELYWNAIIHYATFSTPIYEEKDRSPLLENHELDIIDIGSQTDFDSIFTSLLSSKTSISKSDKEVIKTFIEIYESEIISLLPDEIPMKENIAYICGLILKYPGMIYPMLKFVKTPTDILRLTVSFSDGDVSLAKNTKFRKFKRPERKFLLGLLEKCNTNLSEEMVKYRGNFIRLGEILHPGEFKVKFPRSFKAFTDLREEKRIETFNTRVEESIINRDIAKSIKLLSTRPGDFARRLDHLFRINDNKPAVRNRISKEFFKVADKVLFL